MSSSVKPMTVGELARLIGSLVMQPATSNVAVTGELSDVSLRRGHCYFELVDKDANGMPSAKLRATVWASNASKLIPTFEQATGQKFASGIKVLLRGSVTMHPVYGLSLVVNDIDPTYTLGDLERRRMEILNRLQADGVLENNRSLHWPDIPTRIAIISAPGAAGYGDFINQLFTNPEHIRFEAKLFEAVMQGDRAPASIIAALDRVNSELERWDCVVIIRGGGATTDLQAFENYELAANVAQFPIPVIIGIGHERDITVLDWVANMRVKTPTAAAEWLIARAESLLTALRNYGSKILHQAADMLSGAKEQLSYNQGLLPQLAIGLIERNRARLTTATATLTTISSRRIAPALERINLWASTLQVSAPKAIITAGERLEAKEALLKALSPEAVLARGYSITRNSEGEIIKSARDLQQGEEIVTVTANGEITSIVK